MSLIPDQLRGLRNPSLSGAVIALTGVIALLYYGRNLLITLSTAVILAFILEPLVHLLVRIRVPRALASVIVCAVAGLVLYLMALGFYSQVASLIEELPNYRQRIAEISDSISAKVEGAENSAYELLMPKRMAEKARTMQAARETEIQKKKQRRRATAAPVPPPLPVPAAQDASLDPNAVPEVRIRPDRPPALDYIYSQLGSIYEMLLMISFVPFLVYFMLSWRDHVYRSFLQLFHEEARLVASRTIDGIADMVRAFVVGNFVLGMFLTVLSTIAFSWMALPYPVLIGSLSGFVSLVPYFGLPLALLPPILATVAKSTTLAPYLLISAFVAGLHLVGLNLLYPKIVGQRVHLNPLVVTIALMLWGALWGAPGFLLAIPLTAAIKAICDNVASLEPYGRFLGDSRPLRSVVPAEPEPEPTPERAESAVLGRD